jgi:hypothetical protein
MRVPSTGHHVGLSTRRLGFSLVEALVVIVGLSLVLTLTAGIIVVVMKLQRSGADALQSMIVQKELADVFRSDVANASAAPDEFGRYKSGPQCLLLRKDNGDIIVYQWQSGFLERSLLTHSTPDRRLLPVGTASTVPKFQRSDDHRLVTLRLETHGGLSQSVEISAALGGDLR